MKVYLKYRNYKPLHAIYLSLVDTPPSDVEYQVPPAKKELRKFFGLYRRIKYLKIAQMPIRLIEKLLFTSSEKDYDADIYEYINMIDIRPPSKPYIVDLEHAAMLTGFAVSKQHLERVKGFLGDKNCKGIICLSKAAQRTLKELLGDDYQTMANKVHMVYPALPEAKIRADYSLINKNPNILKFLFVGSPPYLKGLEELLLAVDNLNKLGLTKSYELHAITDGYESILSAHNLELPNVHFYKPNFSKDEILSKFFMPADALIMPSKIDTFGMAILDAQVCKTAVIATRQFAMSELVEDRVDGLLLDLQKPLYDNVLLPSKSEMEQVTESHVIEQLVAEIERVLINVLEGKVDLQKLGEGAGKNFLPGGKFSVDVRNKKLLEIYKHALPSGN